MVPAKRPLKERLGDLHQLAIAHNNLAEIEFRLDRPAAALASAQRSVRLLEQVGAHGDLADSWRNVAESAVALGELGPGIVAATRDWRSDRC